MQWGRSHADARPVQDRIVGMPHLQNSDSSSTAATMLAATSTTLAMPECAKELPTMLPYACQRAQEYQLHTRFMPIQCRSLACYDGPLTSRRYDTLDDDAVA